MPNHHQSHEQSHHQSRRARALRLAALLCALCLLVTCTTWTGGARADEHPGWVKFLLICNEGMNNSGGNAGNTIMAVAMNPTTGKIRLAMFTWDTFVDYEGYDLPQRIDMPYRNNGPEETMRVMDHNFGLDIDHYMSLNYLNLAGLIDAYGGVEVNITRAERNALNGKVGSKKRQIQAQADMGLLSQLVIELLADEFYLNEYGPNTHLNGLQAVGYGWLQYDSVYNCCERDAEVISKLFHSVGQSMHERIAFYNGETGVPEPDVVSGRRLINLDNPTDSDIAFIRQQIAPIFQMSYHNLSEEDIISITLTLARTAFNASIQGVNIFDLVEYGIFPVEAKEPYQLIAGAEGHLVNKELNHDKMEEFLYRED